ncbi:MULTISPECIES: hypothetical protein [unclassified Imperialibacter]|uniref:hypothetical protein n=1 Tax=unclassified Imperialibacter TaxID=2629706 RepID=UPI00125B5394|nr:MULTISPECIES: hypothetical protein [unclassified Imperialibacter]CAD5277596.1 hypothetical protein IMPERIA75_420208 [Imperialibacter sp. 75]CAD5295477.1 hypothetical protein IMPERIA89_660206 [Imperialibacter sp. 89]VVT12026.1 hypothetical protein IMPR6_20081 [Imperialibacter sp. EC-SDR9]
MATIFLSRGFEYKKYSFRSIKSLIFFFCLLGIEGCVEPFENKYDPDKKTSSFQIFLTPVGAFDFYLNKRNGIEKKYLIITNHSSADISNLNFVLSYQSTEGKLMIRNVYREYKISSQQLSDSIFLDKIPFNLFQKERISVEVLAVSDSSAGNLYTGEYLLKTDSGSYYGIMNGLINYQNKAFFSLEGFENDFDSLNGFIVSSGIANVILHRKSGNDYRLSGETSLPGVEKDTILLLHNMDSLFIKLNIEQ